MDTANVLCFNVEFVPSVLISWGSGQLNYFGGARYQSRDCGKHTPRAIDCRSNWNWKSRRQLGAAPCRWVTLVYCATDCTEIEFNGSPARVVDLHNIKSAIRPKSEIHNVKPFATTVHAGLVPHLAHRVGSLLVHPATIWTRASNTEPIPLVGYTSGCLFEFLVFLFSLQQNRKIRISVFPECEEILICFAAFALVAR